MKKFILYIFLSVLLLGSCTQQGQWDREQRRQMRQMLNQWREMVYLSDMTDAEFVIFSDDMVAVLEESYPNYLVLTTMPYVNDTITNVIVSTIVDDIQANARNMRHIYPYRMLVSAGILADGLSREQLTMYYSCLAGKVNSAFGSLENFIYAMMDSTVDNNIILGFQKACASQVVIVEESITEEVITPSGNSQSSTQQSKSKSSAAKSKDNGQTKKR